MSSAAPGIDQATMTGCRVTQLAMRLTRPDPTEIAQTHEAV